MDGVGRGALVAGALLGGLQPLGAQTQLPMIVVDAPSPIVRRAPAPRPPTTATPPSAPIPTITVNPLPQFQGTLPVVADQFATVTVLPREEIERRPGGTLGDLLFDKPGITGSSFAPGGASRPIVRGLDNYRVRVQENGLAVNDVSDLSEDHAVPIDPFAARRVEVIRGPATLRWGSQAIGGVVNVDNNRIPTALPPRPITGEVFGAFSSVDRGLESGIMLDGGAGNVAVHADAHGRNARDYRIPGYPYLNPPDPAPVVNGNQPNSAARNDGWSLGGSYIFNQGFVGASVTQLNSLYRIPGVEATETNTRIDMRQTKFNSKGEFRPDDGPVAAIRFWLGLSDYKHDELANEGGFDGVQQSFTNKSQEGRVEVQLAPFDLRFAALTTALGVQASRTQLAAPGLEGGLFDPNEQKSVAAFVFNEFKFTDTFRMQIAGRIERVTASGSSPDFPANHMPDGSDLNVVNRASSYTPMSASIGFLKDLPFGLTASLTAQHVERAPRTPELYSRGVHEATGTFEIGDPNLKIESAETVEVGLRRAQGPLRFEATAFHTHFKNFIFKRFTGLSCAEDFNSCVDPAVTPNEFRQIVYSQRNANFTGAELQAQYDVAPIMGGMFGVDGQLDVVRARFEDGSNVPRIPPVRVGGGVFWRDANWFVRVGLLHAFAQNNTAEFETPTDGYNLLKAEISYMKQLEPSGFGPRELRVGVTGNNLLNENIRNAVSFKKDEVLMPGANVRAFASVRF